MAVHKSLASAGLFQFGVATAAGRPTPSHTRLVLESKAEMRRRNVASPDECDAVALTFAEPVAPRSFRRPLEYPELGVV